MPDSDKPRGLELEQDLAFETAEWRAVRVTWIVLLLVMVGTGLGLFGAGPLSSVSLPAPDAPFSVEYGRFGRFGASMRLAVQVPPDADGAIRFSLNQEFVQAFRIDTITPDPAEARLVPDGIEYRFDAEHTARRPVIFELQPARRWLVRGSVRAPEGTREFWQFIYP